jgi:hypothetical protein
MEDLFLGIFCTVILVVVGAVSIIGEIRFYKEDEAAAWAKLDRVGKELERLRKENKRLKRKKK